MQVAATETATTVIMTHWEKILDALDFVVDNNLTLGNEYITDITQTMPR